MAERAFRGPGLDRPVNIKSASKSILSALVGIALERRRLHRARPAGRPDPRRTSCRRIRTRCWPRSPSTTCCRCGPGSTAPRARITGAGPAARTGCATSCLAALRRPARRSDAVFDRRQPPAVGRFDPADRPQHAGADARLAGPAAGHHHPGLAARPAGHLCRRQRHGAVAPRPAALRRAVPPGRRDRRQAGAAARAGSRRHGRRAPGRPSPATPMAMAGSSPRRRAIRSITPGASAGRWSMSCPISA